MRSTPLKIVGAALLALSSIQAAAKADDRGCYLDQTWFACTDDRDCVLIDGFCGGDHAVNRVHAEPAYEHYFGCLKQAHCRYVAGEPKAACDRELGRCVTLREDRIRLRLGN